MTLITSISGIRGTIGDGLTPPEIIRYTSAYGAWISQQKNHHRVMIGRDARPSGEMIKNLVINTLIAMGIDVEDLDFATTPTIEMAVINSNASGGIIITASHNPENWNALKLLNHKGEFLTPKEADELFELAKSEGYKYSDVSALGTLTNSNALDHHIDSILNLDLVNPEEIEKASLKVAVDVVNSVGAISIPPFLERLGVKNYTVINGDMNGHFSHNPEPLPENLQDLAKIVSSENYDLGIAVDPDVDRLCFVCENGDFFGEEYTLVSVADYWLSKFPGNTVSNLSSTRALSDITKKFGGNYFASAVGEINVVEEMKKQEAVIGGEGNGGVIIPDLHYGRDALAGIALFLSFLATSNRKVSEIKASYPQYFMAKQKIQLDGLINVDEVLKSFKDLHQNEKVNDIDGVKIDFEESWVHLRKSNTEPIIRIYSEAKTKQLAEDLASHAITKLNKIIKVKV